MLGIFLIYFIGKQFFDLAKEYNRNEWGYAVLGAVMYYVGTFVGGIILALIFFLIDGDFNAFDEIDDLLLSLMGLPFGLFMSWLTYQFLEKKFNKDGSAINTLNDNILDEGL